MKYAATPFHRAAARALLPLGLALSVAGCATPASSGQAASGFAKGADISWVSEMEQAKLTFQTRAGAPRDLFALLKEQGMDSVRLRIWVNPKDGWNGIADTIAKAQRAKAAGLRIMLDFHYSDSWADPQQQTKPAAWANHTVAQLASAVADHTRTSLVALRDAGITPEWVQVGNETRDGLLWPDGRASTNMPNYALFVNSGYDAVKSVFPQALVIVHVDNCHDNGKFRWNFDGLKANGAKFDMIAASSYPTTAVGMDWQAATAACLVNLNDMVDRYGKPVIVSEVGVPWDHPQGKTIIADLIAKTRAVKNQQGRGVFYWEPQSNGWNGYSMGAFDKSGKPTATMDAFLER